MIGRPAVSPVAAAFDLRGRRALVTGGTQGAGPAVVLALAEAGADVVACHHADRPGRADPSADALARGLAATPGQHRQVHADPSRPEDVARLIDTCRSDAGWLDIVVNVAGVGSPVPFAELTPDEWRRVVDADLTAAFLVTQAALPLLPAGSAVINVSHRSGEAGGVPAGGVPAAAAQAGLAGLTRALATELGPEGIRLNLVIPGPADAAQIAAVVVFLASDEAGFVTGQTVPVDGSTR
jgi:NAD(P)-dependent dehydrogenase (short-subunit alcohol dehydrogenase family)